MVRICEVAEVGKEHGKMRLRITQRNAKENALFPFPPTSGPLNITQVVVSDRLQLKIPCGGEDSQGYNGGHRPSWPDKVPKCDHSDDAKQNFYRKASTAAERCSGRPRLESRRETDVSHADWLTSSPFAVYL